TLPEYLDVRRVERSRACSQKAYPRNFRWLLRLSGKAKRKKHEGNNQAENSFLHWIRQRFRGSRCGVREKAQRKFQPILICVHLKASIMPVLGRGRSHGGGRK